MGAERLLRCGFGWVRLLALGALVHGADLRGHRHAEGWLFGLYCVLAGLERFIVEFFRAKDDRFFYDMFTMAQVIAILVFFVGAGLMWARWRTGPGRPGIYANAVA